MKIFVSYAREDRSVAESIALALRAQRHDVFFDREDLPAGEEYDNRIRRAIESADLMIFLISPHALDAGSYTLTELQIADRAWRHPGGRLLPVRLQPVPSATLPPLLKSVTLFDPPGNVTASVAEAVHRIALARRRRRLKFLAIGATVAIMVIAVGIGWQRRGLPVEMRGSDGAPMVLVPAGVFEMGDDENAPARPVYVDAFYIDRYEVTTARYARFIGERSAQTPDEWESLDVTRGGELPVVGVSWHEANAYCEWANRRLPTEAEWEKAARGSDGRRYPWGNAPAQADRANFENFSPSVYDGGVTPVGRFTAGKSPFGAHDMAGNVSEWVADWYSERFNASDRRNPKGPDRGSGKVIRGGGRFDRADRIVATKRYHATPDTRANDIGFRCARNA